LGGGGVGTPQNAKGCPQVPRRDQNKNKPKKKNDRTAPASRTKRERGPVLAGPQGKEHKMCTTSSESQISGSKNAYENHHAATRKQASLHQKIGRDNQKHVGSRVEKKKKRGDAWGV